MSDSTPPQPHGRRLSRPALLLAAVLAVVLAAATAGYFLLRDGSDTRAPGDGGPDKVQYLTSFQLFGRDAYAHVAQAKGFFADENITVDIAPGTGGRNLSLIASGRAQFAAADFINIIEQYQRNDDVIALAAIQQRPLSAVMARKSSGITRPSDLTGKSVGLTVGSATHTLLPAYLRMAGVDPATVRVRNVEGNALPAVLANRQVDAIGQFVIGQRLVSTVVEEPVNVLPFSDYLTDLYGIALITSRHIAENDRDLAVRMRRAILRGLTYALQHPQEAAQILKKAVPATIEAAAVAELEAMSPYTGLTGSDTQAPVYGRFEAPRVARAIAICQGQKIIPEAIAPERLVDFTINAEPVPTP